MFIPVPFPEEMAQWDAEAIRLGLPEETLMENAARCAMESLRTHWAGYGVPLAGTSVLLIAGSGNNGGDAFCMARHLLDAGAAPVLVCTREPDGYRGAARHWLNVAMALDIPVFSAEAWLRGDCPIPTRPDIVIDGLLGTGFHGTLREREARIVAKVNSIAAPFVLAVDIPSGLDAHNGRPCPDAVRAHVTVTFQAAKPGLLVPEAEAFTGRLDVRPIGMPRRVQEKNPPSCRTWLLPAQAGGDPAAPYVLEHGATPLAMNWLRQAAVPGTVRKKAWHGPAHKGEAGRVLIVGGCSDYTGAPCLAGLGALRCGAGLVTVAGPENVLHAVRSTLPTLTTLHLPPKESGQEWHKDALRPLIPAIRSSRALVFGPGLGRSEGAAEFADALLNLPQRPPMVIDADALFALTHRPELLQKLRPGDVLTPHPGEAASLLGVGSADVQADRFSALAELSRLAPAVWVLKGAGTLIAVPDEPTVVSPWNVPQLAVAGSGDVLAGAVGAFLAQGFPSGLAATLGVWLHALAGLRLSETFPMRGCDPHDIANAMPSVLTALGVPEKGEPCLSF